MVNRRINWTGAHKSNHRRAMKKLWKDPKWRAKTLKARDTSSWTKEHKRNHRKKMKKLWKDPKWREFRESRIQWTAKERSRRSKLLKKLWKDPNWRVSASAGRRKGIRKAMKDPQINERMRAAQNMPSAIRRRERTLSRMGGRESGTEFRVRRALHRPHRDILLFGRRWDMSFPQVHSLVEVQGCYFHKCKRCGFGEGGDKVRARDLKKRLIAEGRGWRVLYIWGHEEKKVLGDPRGWMKRHGLVA